MPPPAAVVGVTSSPQPPVTSEPAPPPRRTWYGGQIFIVDAAAAASLGLGVALEKSNSDDSALALAGVLGYWLGGPVVHIAHGHVFRALGSAGIRFFAPGVGGAVGLLASACVGLARCDGTPITLGVITGALVASAIDGFALAYDEKKPARAPVSLVLVPTFAPIPHGFSLGVAGSFERR